MPLDKVAFIISVCPYDRFDWFVESINSIRYQDYSREHIRIYLGIDGPVSVNINQWIEENRAEFEIIIRNEKMIGLAKTLNRLIAVIQDEAYVFRMDSDDICLPSRTSLQIRYLKSNSEVKVVGGAIWEFTDSFSVYWKKIYPLTHEKILQYITKANPFAHSTVCFRRDFFDIIPGYPETTALNQDLALWNLALKNGIKFGNIENPVLCLRTSAFFYKRRGYARAVSEFKLYFSATYLHYGLNWRMIFPVLRFLFRLMPPFLTRKIYQSQFRDWLRQK